MNSAIDRTKRIPAATYRYAMYGLTFETGEPIPDLAEADGAAGAVVVRIRFANAPQTIEKPDYQDETVQASATEYLFAYPGVLRLYVERGGEIVAERLEGCNSVRLRTLILGVGASIAGFRNGFIPLHASALEACGGCVALAGQSGFGKSTLAASLVDLGFALHADDLCLIQPGTQGLPLVGTGIREIRLREDAAETLGWAGRQGTIAIPGTTAKAAYRVAAERPTLLPLKRIYALQCADAETPAGIHRIGGVAAMQTLIGCLRMRIGHLLVGARERAFESLASISSAVEVYRFVRPFDRSQLHQWTMRLAEHLSA